jgi:hypothetical protein
VSGVEDFHVADIGHMVASLETAMRHIALIDRQLGEKALTLINAELSADTVARIALAREDCTRALTTYRGLIEDLETLKASIAAAHE